MLYGSSCWAIEVLGGQVEFGKNKNVKVNVGKTREDGLRNVCLEEL